MKPVMRRLGLRFAIALALCGSIGVLLFYAATAWAARFEAERAGLPPAARNSIKHAYAAAETYAWLRSAGIGPNTATELVVYLGIVNEGVEAWFKWPRDTTSEVYKDLRNNMLGIAALRAKEKCTGLGTPDTRLRLIGKLAAEQILLWSSTDSRIPPMTADHDVGAAVATFMGNRPVIENEAASAVRNLRICEGKKPTGNALRSATSSTG